jgi:putative Mg2+ transporter-C (MgtC) family protein
MIPFQEITFRLLLGAVIGGIIGFEREVHGRAAGFRTQLIVCVAAVLIMIVSENYYLRLQDIDPSFRIDPARIAASALIGIGFLGAGVIIKSGFAIRGLTTAASIWIVSVIGLAIGGGFYLSAILTSLITIIALVILRKVEKAMKILQYKKITVSTRIDENAEEKIASVIRDHDISIYSTDYRRDSTKGEIVYTFSVFTRDSNVLKNVFLKLGTMDYIKTVQIDSGDRALI